MPNPRCLVLALALLIPACGGDGGGTVDGAPGPSPVGTWRQLPFAFENPLPIDQRNTLTYGSDGTLVWKIDGATRMWRYASEAGSILLTATDGAEPHAMAFPYVIDQDVYVGDALAPTVSDGGGPIDVWVSHSKSNDEAIDVTWDLRQGGAATITTMRASTGPVVKTGNWGGDGPDLQVTISQSEHLLGRLQGNRLGVPYERVP